MQNRIFSLVSRLFKRMPLNLRKKIVLAGLLAFIMLQEVALAEETAIAPIQQVPTGQSVKQETQPASFDLWELRVKGNTLLDKKELERTVYPFLGPQKSIDQVEAARLALERLYQGKGYQTVTVDIPEQAVQQGVVNLLVVEGKVSRLRVTDSRYFALGKIKATVPEVAEGNVPNFKVMQKQLGDLASQSADRKIQPILRAGETPGTLEVDLKVKDELPLHGRVELNGRNTTSTSRLRLVSSLRYDNLWQKFHSASFSFQTSPENNSEVEVFSGTYVLPWFETDARLALFAVSSNSNAQIASAGALNVVGIGSVYGLRFIKPFTSFNSYNHSLTLGADYKDFQEDLRLVGADSILTPISYLPFLTQYAGSFRGNGYASSFDLGLYFSIRGLGNRQAEFENKRFLARSNYAYLRGNLNFKYDLPKGWGVSSRFSGQVADSPLISNEQFSIGGASSVRGYFETQVLADDGFVGSLEFISPDFVPDGWEFVNKLSALVFVDAGTSSIKNALPGNSQGNTLASAGAGLHFKLAKIFSAALDLGFPFVSIDRVKSGDPRLHFSLATDF
ncbi:MAG: ShlB/FhaC/HecB family hemolysin secretion/activation protein [Methylococcaceae bacterium]|jgi:hemolysin activation/secretion protein